MGVDEALLASAVYVDLNLWRAGMAADLADSEFSSLLLRMQQLQAPRSTRKRNKASVRRRRKTRSVRETLGTMLIAPAYLWLRYLI